MNRPKTMRFLVPAALALAAFGAGAAHARTDVQWSVTVGTPVYTMPAPVVVAPRPVYVAPPPVYYVPPRPVVRYVPAPVYVGHWGYRDHDRDGIPNRYDRHYNPRWDRDGDGIPNRYDARYTPHWDVDGDGIPNRHDRHPRDGRR